jgi:pyruvate dehydrogenase E2 component (dihydrolipoamide acetyltransferase)
LIEAVFMPQQSMSMEAGTVNLWTKSVGQRVDLGEVIAEIETDKLVFELEAPVGGTLVEILVGAGQEAAVRTVIARIESGTPAEESSAGDSVPEPTAPRSGDDPGDAGTAVAVGRQITPAARRLAREAGVDLDTVTGSGPGGRVTEDDVRGHHAGSAQGAADGVQDRPLAGTRGQIAARMVQSLQAMAQFTMTAEADITALLTARAARPQMKATVTHLAMRAVARALRRHPRLNSVIRDDSIILLPDINIGLAVALDEGLVVPVVEGVDLLALDELARTADEAISLARSGRHVQRRSGPASFTISNLGPYGVDIFTPIINPPQVAILGLGRFADKAVDQDGQVAWRKCITLSLTVDHRAIDGVPAAQFLQECVLLLADPGLLD